MKQTIRSSFTATLPVLTGYLVLGFGFGIILRASGHGVLTAFVMSLTIYAGSMQYAAVGLLSGGASIATAALTTLMVNARHLFYGISMLEKYKDTGKIKPYLIFALTDETYSLVCGDVPVSKNGGDAQKKRSRYYFCVSLFNQIYWITGSVAGAVVGSLVSFNSEGIDFALTALFVTVFVEQWLSEDKHIPALIGVGAAAVCLLIFGSEHFLIPTMLIITAALCLYTDKNDKRG